MLMIDFSVGNAITRFLTTGHAFASMREQTMETLFSAEERSIFAVKIWLYLRLSIRNNKREKEREELKKRNFATM